MTLYERIAKLERLTKKMDRTICCLLTDNPGAPFDTNSAYNGLSVDPVTGQIVLGNDVGSLLAQLVSDRVIPDGGFSVIFGDPAANAITIAPSFLFIDLFDNVSQRRAILSAGVTPNLSLSGDLAGGAAIQFLGFGGLDSFDIFNSAFLATSSLKTAPQAFPGIGTNLLSTGNFQIGEFNTYNTDSGETLQIVGSDLVQVLLYNITNSIGFRIQNVSATGFIVTDNDIPEHIFLRLDYTNDIYQIGDISAYANGLRVDILNSLNLIQIGDTANVSTQSILQIDNAIGELTFNVGGATYFQVGLPGVFRLGVSGSGAIIVGNATSQNILLTAVNGVAINGVSNPNTPFTVVGLPAFADNAAAVAGGLAAGDFYRTSAGGSSTVRVVQ